MKESMDHSLPLLVPTRSLDSQLRASEAVRRELQSQRCQLLFELNEKDRAIELAKAEASMSSRALKRFAEENQKLAAECAKLVLESKTLEKECSLFDSDLKALMNFANEAQHRADDAEARVHTLEEEVLQYKRELDSYKESGTAKSTAASEENLLESILGTFVDKDECSSAGSFLESYGGHESCTKLLRMENLLKPATVHKILSLAAKVERLLKEKEELTVNLQRAEEEVKLLFDDNNYLDEENKMLSMFYHHGIGSNSSGSGSNGISKSNKRKSSHRMYSPIEKISDLNDAD